MDDQLKQQLERVRELSARVERIHEQLVENAELIARDRERLRGHPLSLARDVRPWREPERAERRVGPVSSNQEAHRESRQRANHSSSRNSSRRRR